MAGKKCSDIQRPSLPAIFFNEQIQRTTLKRTSLHVRFPKSMFVAIRECSNDFVSARKRECSFRFVARVERFALSALSCLNINPHDVVLRFHWVSSRTNFHRNFASIYFDNRNMFFLRTVRSVRYQFNHVFSAAFYLYAARMNHSNDVSAMLADVKLYAH